MSIDTTTLQNIVEDLADNVNARIAAYLAAHNAVIVDSAEESVIWSAMETLVQGFVEDAKQELIAKGTLDEAILDKCTISWDHSKLDAAADGLSGTWTGNLALTSMEDAGIYGLTDLSPITWKLENADEINSIFDNLQSIAPVTYLLTNASTSDVGALDDKEYKAGFQGKVSEDNNLTNAIRATNSSIASVTTDLGEIAIKDNDPNNKFWYGTVTIELANGVKGSKEVYIPLNFVDGVAEYTGITIQDSRKDVDKQVEVGTTDGKTAVFSFKNIVVTLEKSDGSTETLVGDKIQEAINDGTIVLDTGSYNKDKLGKYNVYLRIPNDNEKFVAVDVQVVRTGIIEPTEVNFAVGTTIDAITSKDPSILKPTSGAGYVVYAAGETEVTVTDDKGTTVTARATVAENGAVTFETDFATVIVDKIIGSNFASLAAGQNATVSVKDPIVTAKYVQDADGTEHVYLTPVAVGNTQMTLTFGSKGKLCYTYDVSVNDKGIISIKENGNGLHIAKLSLPANTKKALEETDYYSTASHTNNLRVKDLENADSIVVKGVIGSSLVNMNELPVTVTTTTGIVDTVMLSTTKMEFSQAYYVDRKNSKPTELVVSFGGAKEVTDVTLKQKIDVTFDDLLLVPETFTCDDQYVDVVKNGTNSFSIIPKNDASTDHTTNVSFYDENGGSTVVTVTVNGFTIKQTQVSTPVANLDSVEYTQPTVQEYTIGDEISVEGSSYSYIPNGGGNRLTVKVRPEMFSDANGNKLSTDEAKTYTNVKFQYGNYTSEEVFSVTVNPAEVRLTTEDLGLAPNDTIAYAEMVDDGEQKISVGITSDGYIYFQSKAINKDGVALVTTKSGNTAYVYIDVDEDGNISAVSDVNFKATVKTITPEELGIYADSLENNDEDCVNAVVQAGSVVVKSLTPGDASITVTDKEGKTSKIDVTVYADGSMGINVTKPITEGWVDLGNGDWGYIRNGERVVSDWVSVQEADPYNGNKVGTVWYHIGSDGLMQRGWIVDETGWKIYLLDSNGRMMHSQWVNAPAQESLNRPAGLYHLTPDGAVQMNGWAESVDNENILWFCNAGNGLFEVDNPTSWRVVG